MAAIAPHDITAVVLCGGEGKRMGGVDKPLVLFRGRPLVQHVLDGLQDVVGDIVLVANRTLDAYRALGPRVICDNTPYLGPLGGIASAAPHVRTPWMYLCAGDAPFAGSAVLQRLASHEPPEGQSERPRVAHDGVRAQPLFAVIPLSVVGTATAALTSESHSVYGWLAAQRAQPVDAADLAALMTGIDDPQRLRQLEAEGP